MSIQLFLHVSELKKKLLCQVRTAWRIVYFLIAILFRAATAFFDLHAGALSWRCRTPSILVYLRWPPIISEAQQHKHPQLLYLTRHAAHKQKSLQIPGMLFKSEGPSKSKNTSVMFFPANSWAQNSMGVSETLSSLLPLFLSDRG
jgi:hypothetical protein